MQLKYQVCDFTVPFKDNLYGDEESMREVLKNPEFQARLKGNDLIGAISHEFRWEQDEVVQNGGVGLPESDLLLLRNKAANVVTDIYIEDHKLICTLKVLESTESGKSIKKLIEEDEIIPDVSMVVDQDIMDGKIKFYDFIGVDFTFRPALATKYEGMYSKKRRSQNPIFLGFYSETPKRRRVRGSYGEQRKFESYSLREYLRLNKLSPGAALLRLLQEASNFIKSATEEIFEDNKEYIVEYLTSFLYKKITNIINDLEKPAVAINSELRLNRFCSPKDLATTIRLINKIRKERKNLHYITKPTQIALSENIAKLTDSVLDYVSKSTDKDFEDDIPDEEALATDQR